MRQKIHIFRSLKRKLLANILLLSTTFASLLFVGSGIKTANIALNKTATQSSTYEGVWKADNAVDGDKSCSAVDKDHFSGTNGEDHPWWQVDLGRKYPVTKIIVYGRHSSTPVQLKGFQVFISSSASGNHLSIYNNTDYGNGIFEIQVSPYVPGRYVKIVLPGIYRNPVGRKGPLLLCEIEIFSQDLIQDMKRSVSTLMSPKSEWKHDTINWDKDRAIDDIDAYNPDTCSCCSGTTGNDIPWWKLNLGKPFLISDIWIYGRSDIKNIGQSTNLYIYGSNSTNMDGNQSLSQGDTENEGYIYFIKLEEPRLFQYLIIRRWTAGLMTLCEVKLFQADCTVGHYGDRCLRQCHCSNALTCHANTGHCDSCASGWIGDACDSTCSNGTYGLGCMSRCGHCKNNQTCDHVTGHCAAGCDIGYDNADMMCVKPCSNGRYGLGCTIRCGHCKNNQTCDRFTGNCSSGCDNGYDNSDILCVKPCSNGTYGVGCLSRCGHCKNHQTCNHVTGHCSSGCDIGYDNSDIMCVKSCSNGTYGLGCMSRCGHCQNNQTCDHVTGHCASGCDTGYDNSDKLCVKDCPYGTYGQGCANVCGHCINNQTCQHITGKCTSGCDIGFDNSDELCLIACDAIHFGEGCKNVCHCKNNATCDNNNGTCPSAECAAGWQGQACDKVCNNGTYGLRCHNACGKCADVITCNNIDGTCPKFCLPGYRYSDRMCNTQCQPGTYGKNCGNTCGHCEGETACNISTGNCKDGCDPGYRETLCDEECSNNMFGSNCVHQCHCANNTQCNIFNGNCSSGCDFGWTGNNCSLDQNILRRNSTSAVATQSNTYLSCLAIHAIDGRDAPDGTDDQELCKACSVAQNTTHSTKMAWWQVDLGGLFLVEYIKIFGRKTPSEQSQNIRAIISNLTMNGNSTINMIDMNFVSGHVFLKTLSKPRLFRFLQIQKKHPGVLTLCEVKLYEAECATGWFGDSCLSQCHCADNKKCDAVTGQCVNKGCLPGWKGSSCNNSCSFAKFGPDCRYQCNCFQNKSCSTEFGICSNKRCNPGWQLDNCSKACDFPQFGDACNSTCYCLNNTSCDHIEGRCQIGLCEAGWQGDSCNHACNHGKFGLDCSSSCHCLDNSSCLPATGKCIDGLCEPGWQGSSCDRVCDAGTFGQNCSNKCHCDDDINCPPTNGSCKTGICETGWHGNNCSIFLPEKQESPATAAVAGGVSASVVLVALGVVIGFILFKRRKASEETTSKRSQFSHLETRPKEPQRSNLYGHENRSFDGEEETSMNASGGSDYYSFGEQLIGIRIYDLWDYIHEKMENRCEKLFQEFKTLPQGLVHNYYSADNLANRGKNRYRDMYAYDHSRVVLEDVEEEKNTDYINACYIDGYEKLKKFVASQGPTKQMIDDFWRMVWQMKADKIVMLTNLIELGATKCIQYWPKEDEEDECTYGSVVIKLLNTDKYLDYNIRYLEVKRNGEASRRIRQFHFKSWPDKDVPDSTWCLVNFWRAVDTNASSKGGPIVVHCSAGVGRTGTFIALDNLVNQGRKEGSVRPLQIVQALRSQRVNMVQTREQYVYVHEAVADALLFGTHIVWTKQFEDMLTFMLQKEKGDTRSRLQIQFELIGKSVANAASEAADSPEYSNVETIMSESDAYRPKLKNRGSKCVQQLGAIYISNYKGKETFLVSMSPDKGTMEEFWSLVDDSNIKTIIMLTEQSTTCYRSSCDLGSSASSDNRFSVSKIEEKIRKGYTERTYTFKESAREEEESLTTVKQFEHTAWKDGNPVPGDTKSLLDMIESVQKWQPHLSESQPILIHCSDGCSRSGIICVLLNELQRMKYEGGHINIVESVKMMKKRQSHLISNYEQYKYCFDLMMAHIQTTELYQNA